MAVRLVVAKLPEKENAYTNKGYINGKLYKEIFPKGPPFLRVKTLILSIWVDESLQNNEIGLNSCHRESARLLLNDEVLAYPFVPPSQDFNCGILQMQVTSFPRQVSPMDRKPADKRLSLTDTDLEAKCKRLFMGQVVSLQQTLLLKWDELDTLKLTISSIYVHKKGGKAGDIPPVGSQALIFEDTQFIFEAAGDGRVTVRSKKVMQQSLFNTRFNFEELGIGGLDREFSDIFRRAFASRVFPPAIVDELGITHVRGMLLYGPPGTGKTLIARQIGIALKARAPKIVNGPEILNKYVGQSEENIRKLFGDAEEEYKKSGDNSALHIIIFDEIDAICKHRGSTNTGTGVNDSIVNQLLSKIDGVDALNNILLIGMTNRLDMIDEALLRPGRLEVHIEIGLPDEKGRIQILRIHTKKMRDSNRLEEGVLLEELATKTKNFSGAEIEGLVRSAASYAFERQIDFHDLSKPTDVDSIKVGLPDFEQALSEVKPAYGAQEDEFDKCLKNGIIPYGTAFDHLLLTCDSLTRQIQEGAKTQILSVLLHGPIGSGKTAIAAHIAKRANFPFMKFITADNFVGYGEVAQTNLLAKAFDDAYKSPLSLIILDNIERLMGYSRIGPRFSNLIMQTLLVLVKKAPPNTTRRLMVIGTTSEIGFLQDSGMAKAFHVNLEVPLVTGPSEIKRVLADNSVSENNFSDFEIDKLCRSGVIKRIGIKQLLLVTEMAAEFSKPEPINRHVFLSCLQDCGFENQENDFDFDAPL